MIPEAAVEAAAKAFLENETGESVWHHTDAEDETRRRVTRILEAAAPHMAVAAHWSAEAEAANAQAAEEWAK